MAKKSKTKPAPRTAPKAAIAPAVAASPTLPEVPASPSLAEAPVSPSLRVARGPRIAIVAGLRTPFAKQSTAYAEFSAQDLARTVVRELLARTSIDPKEIGLCVYGQVVPSVHAPNIAREIVLGTGMAPSTDAYSVSRACATSFQALSSAAEAIASGQHTIAVVGGADSASDVPITASRPLARALVELTKARSLADRWRILSRLSPRDLVPVPPAIKEPTTGLTMGASAEIMAKEAGISRAAQDAFAHRSHLRASAAWEEGLLQDEVMHVPYGRDFAKTIARDNTVRERSDLASYAKLKPAFDREYGTVTAGNSSPLTDGASALLLMREDVAKALGYTPLGYLRSYAYAAIDPRGVAPTHGSTETPGSWMLMGPTHATPLALDRAGLTLKDLTLIDMHEAFAAQVLCNVQMFSSKLYAERYLGRSEAIGDIDDARFNIHGGSLALGHPFAATGARMVTGLLRALKRQGGGLGLATACAAGGLGAAFVLETE